MILTLKNNFFDVFGAISNFSLRDFTWNTYIRYAIPQIKNSIEILKKAEKQRKELTTEELQMEIAFTQELLSHLLKIEMLLQQIDEYEFKPVALHFIKALKRYQLSLEDELENKVFFYNARINQSRIIAKYLD